MNSVTAPNRHRHCRRHRWHIGRAEKKAVRQYLLQRTNCTHRAPPAPVYPGEGEEEELNSYNKRIIVLIFFLQKTAQARRCTYVHVFRALSSLVEPEVCCLIPEYRVRTSVLLLDENIPQCAVYSLCC